jgi:radical SAM protein with 4Fe4S-binding SPASM domain
LAETLRYGSERGYAWNGCGASESSLGIEADGSVKGCPSLPTADYVGGNVRNRSLREIWSGLVAEKTERPAELWGFCATCPHAQRCKAGCTWTSHVLFGRPGNNPFCHFRTLELAERGLIETLAPRAAAPGEPFDFGRYDIVEKAIGDTFDKDPLIDMTLVSALFGLAQNSTGVWSKSELATALAASKHASTTD